MSSFVIYKTRLCLSALAVAFTAFLGCGNRDTEVITSASSKFEVDTDERKPSSSPDASPDDPAPVGSPSSRSLPFNAAPSTISPGGDGSRSGGQNLTNGKGNAQSETPGLGRASRPAGTGKVSSPPTPKNDQAAKSKTANAKTAGTKTAGAKSPRKQASSTIDATPDDPAPGEPSEGDATDPAISRLLRQIAELGQRKPQGTTREEMIAELRENHTQRIGVADQVLAAKAADSKSRLTAARSLIESLAHLEQLGAPDVSRQIKTFCQGLAKDSDAAMALLGRQMLFGLQVDDFARGGKGTDPKNLLAQLKGILTSGEQDEQTYMLATQASNALAQGGADSEAKEAFVLIANTFKDSHNPELSAQARGMLEQFKLIELDVPSKLDQAVKGIPGASESLLEAMATVLQAQGIGDRTLKIAMQSANLLEGAQQHDAASKLLDLIEQTFKEHEDPDVAKSATESINMARRRLGLIGKEFVVEGNQLDGTQLDWSKYAGKVVLVDFWATWCAPCLQEMPNIRKTLNEYQDQGFEVVGVSVDEQPQELERFFALQKLPWPNVINYDPKSPKPKDESLAAKCGVYAIPFTVLVGRDGKVAAINLRGADLQKKLKELLQLKS